MLHASPSRSSSLTSSTSDAANIVETTSNAIGIKSAAPAPAPHITAHATRVCIDTHGSTSLLQSSNTTHTTSQQQRPSAVNHHHRGSTISSDGVADVRHVVDRCPQHPFMNADAAGMGGGVVRDDVTETETEEDDDEDDIVDELDLYCQTAHLYNTITTTTIKAAAAADEIEVERDMSSPPPPSPRSAGLVGASSSLSKLVTRSTKEGATEASTHVDAYAALAGASVPISVESSPRDVSLSFSPVRTTDPHDGSTNNNNNKKNGARSSDGSAEGDALARGGSTTPFIAEETDPRTVHQNSNTEGQTVASDRALPRDTALEGRRAHDTQGNCGMARPPHDEPEHVSEPRLHSSGSRQSRSAREEMQRQQQQPQRAVQELFARGSHADVAHVPHESARGGYHAENGQLHNRNSNAPLRNGRPTSSDEVGAATAASTTEASYVPQLMPEFDGELMQIIKAYYLRKSGASGTTAISAASSTGAAASASSNFPVSQPHLFISPPPAAAAAATAFDDIKSHPVTYANQNDTPNATHVEQLHRSGWSGDGGAAPIYAPISLQDVDAPHYVREVESRHSPTFSEGGQHTSSGAAQPQQSQLHQRTHPHAANSREGTEENRRREGPESCVAELHAETTRHITHIPENRPRPSAALSLADVAGRAVFSSPSQTYPNGVPINPAVLPPQQQQQQYRPAGVEGGPQPFDERFGSLTQPPFYTSNAINTGAAAAAAPAGSSTTAMNGLFSTTDAMRMRGSAHGDATSNLLYASPHPSYLGAGYGAEGNRESAAAAGAFLSPTSHLVRRSPAAAAASGGFGASSPLNAGGQPTTSSSAAAAAAAAAGAAAASGSGLENTRSNGGGTGGGGLGNVGGALGGGLASGLSALSSLPSYSSTSFVRAYVSDISLSLEPAIIVSALTAALNIIVVVFLQHHVLDTRDHLGLFLIGSYMIFASYYMIYYFLERFSGSFRRIASQDKKFYIIGNLIKAGILISITPFACIHLVKIIVFDEWESNILRNLGCIYAIPDFISMVIVRRMRWSTWVHHACVVLFNYFSIMNNYQHENVCRCVVVYAAFSSFAYCVNVLLASRFLGVSVNVARVLSFVALVVYALCCAVNWAWQVYYLRRLLTSGHDHWTVYMYMFLISLVMWDDIILNKWLLHHARNNAYAASQHLQQHRMRQQHQQHPSSSTAPSPAFHPQPRPSPLFRSQEDRALPMPQTRLPPRAL